MNDLFNGQGTMTHCSGMTYEGLWVNGRPAEMATKMVVTCEEKLDVVQGTPFSIEVNTLDEEGTLIEGLYEKGFWIEKHIFHLLIYVPIIN